MPRRRLRRLPRRGRSRLPEEAAELANEDLAAYDWRPDGQQEFDARLYLTLDAAGDEIAATQVGDL